MNPSFQPEQNGAFNPESPVGMRNAELTAADMLIDLAFASPAAAPVMPGILAGEVY